MIWYLKLRHSPLFYAIILNLFKVVLSENLSISVVVCSLMRHILLWIGENRLIDIGVRVRLCMHIRRWNIPSSLYCYIHSANGYKRNGLVSFRKKKNKQKKPKKTKNNAGRTAYKTTFNILKPKTRKTLTLLFTCINFDFQGIAATF